MANSNLPARGAPSRRWYATALFQYTVAGVVFGTLFPILATTVEIWRAGLPWSLTHFMLMQQTEPLLWVVDTAPLVLGFLAGAAGSRQDAIAERNAMLAVRERELVSMHDTLEARIDQRTQEVEARGRDMASAVRMARTLAQIHDTPGLLSTAAGMVGEAFRGFAADIYLLDSTGTTARRVASSAAPEAAADETVPSVQVGDTSLVGQVAASRRMLVTSRPAVYRLGESTQSSPEESAHATLPLIARGQMLGVLDVYSVIPSSAADLPSTEVLELLADQIAAAIENTRLLEGTQSALAQLEQLSGTDSAAGWQRYAAGRNLAFQYTPTGTRVMRRNLEVREGRDLQVPIIVRGQQIGSIAVRRAASDPWTLSDRELAQETAEQVALSLENARLLEETRQRAAREQRMGAIASRLTGSVDVDTLLQNVVRELAALPDVADASVVLKPEAANNPAAG